MAPSASLVTKIKVQLKLAIARLRMVQQRDEALSKAQRRAMAQLLEAGKVDSARIRVENIIRMDITTELHEILELYCELLIARAGLLEGATCDPGLEEAVKSIIYAAPKTEIKELQAVRVLLADKYGKEFVLSATENADRKVGDKVVRKLAVAPPKEELVTGYLEEIARAYGVEWPRRREAVGEPPDLLDEQDLKGNGDDDDDGGPSGGQMLRELETAAPAMPDGKSEAGRAAREQDELEGAVPPPRAGPGEPVSPLRVVPPKMTTDNVHPRVTLNSMELKPSAKMTDALGGKKAASGAAKGGNGKGPAGTVPDVDELERRFAALKRP